MHDDISTADNLGRQSSARPINLGRTHESKRRERFKRDYAQDLNWFISRCKEPLALIAQLKPQAYEIPSPRIAQKMLKKLTITTRNLQDLKQGWITPRWLGRGAASDKINQTIKYLRWHNSANIEKMMRTEYQLWYRHANNLLMNEFRPWIKSAVYFFDNLEQLTKSLDPFRKVPGMSIRLGIEELDDIVGTLYNPKNLRGSTPQSYGEIYQDLIGFYISIASLRDDICQVLEKSESQLLALKTQLESTGLPREFFRLRGNLKAAVSDKIEELEQSANLRTKINPSTLLLLHLAQLNHYLEPTQPCEVQLEQEAVGLRHQAELEFRNRYRTCATKERRGILDDLSLIGRDSLELALADIEECAYLDVEKINLLRRQLEQELPTFQLPKPITDEAFSQDRNVGSSLASEHLDQYIQDIEITNRLLEVNPALGRSSYHELGDFGRLFNTVVSIQGAMTDPSGVSQRDYVFGNIQDFSTRGALLERLREFSVAVLDQTSSSEHEASASDPNEGTDSLSHITISDSSSVWQVIDQIYRADASTRVVNQDCAKEFPWLQAVLERFAENSDLLDGVRLQTKGNEILIPESHIGLFLGKAREFLSEKPAGVLDPIISSDLPKVTKSDIFERLFSHRYKPLVLVPIEDSELVPHFRLEVGPSDLIDKMGRTFSGELVEDPALADGRDRRVSSKSFIRPLNKDEIEVYPPRYHFGVVKLGDEEIHITTHAISRFRKRAHEGGLSRRMQRILRSETAIFCHLAELLQSSMPLFRLNQANEYSELGQKERDEEREYRVYNNWVFGIKTDVLGNRGLFTCYAKDVSWFRWE